MEKRRDKRHLKQLTVRFGEKGREHVGLSHDLSTTGLLLKGNRIYPPKTSIFLELSLNSGEKVSAQGVVQWAKRVPPAMASLVQNGMGIKFIDVPSEYIKFIDSL